MNAGNTTEGVSSVHALRASEKRLDRAAIAAVREGNTQRFQEIIERYQHRMVALIGRQTGDLQVAEDLAQDTFIRALRGIRNFREEAEFSTWLIRIALNVTNSYFSSKRYRQQRVSESFDSTRHDAIQSGGEDSSEEENDTAGKRAAFREALAELKPHLRETIVLCVFEGKQYQEAADLLGIPVGTVRSRLNKARLLLRAKLVSK